MTNGVDASGSRNCSTAREDDDTDIIQWGELRRLRKVFEASSDLSLAYSNQEFRDACGGMEDLKIAHSEAVRSLEQWYSEGDDSFCR